MNNDFDEKMKAMLTEMLGWFHLICEKNQLRYYILGGTMLGAMRHHGFIPWDDDIDVGLPRADYIRLIELMDHCKHERYCLETPYGKAKEFLYTYSKIYDTETTLIEHTKKKIKRGIFLDVFPLDGVNPDLEIAKAEYNRIDALRRFLVSRATDLRKGRSFYKNMAVVFSGLIPFVNEKGLALKVDSLCQKYDFDNSEYVGCLMSPYRFREVMKKTVFGTPTLYDFEHLKVYGPEQANEYLTNLYGDWNMLPPKEKRVTHHDFVRCDLEKPYRV